MRTIKFADSQTGWAAGGDGYTNPLGAEYSIILKTTNGGINWIQQFYSDFGPIYYEMSVINQDKVFAIFSGLDYWSGTMGGVTKTTNGGINWLPDSSAAVYRSAYNSIYFVNQTGWIICYRSVEGFPGPIKVIKTTNTGQSWFVAYQDTTTRFFHRKIQFIDSQIGYVSKPRFRKSTNGGSNWYIMDSLMTSGNSDAFFVNKDTGWICGNFSGNNY